MALTLGEGQGGEVGATKEEGLLQVSRSCLGAAAGEGVWEPRPGEHGELPSTLSWFFSLRALGAQRQAPGPWAPGAGSLACFLCSQQQKVVC